MVTNRNISIMHLVSSLNCGGVESVVVNLCNGLVANGFNVAICVLQDKARMAERLNSEYEIPVFTCGLPSKLRPSNAIQCIKKIRNAINQFNPDLIHSHLYSYTAPFAYFATCGKSFRHVLSLHFAGLHYHDMHIRHKISRICERWTIKHASQVVIGCSSYVNQMAKDVLRVNSPRLIYNGIDVDKFSRSHISQELRLELRRKIGAGNDDILVACVGHLKHVKNQTAIIAAWSQVVSVIPNAKLVLIGDGPDRAGLENQSRETGLNDHVIFLGARSDIRELLSACDAGMLYSLSEAFGLALVEMMSMELPVIGSDIPAICEVISQDVGMTAKSNSPDELATVLIKMLSDRDNMRTLGKNGRLRAEKIFSLDSQAKAFSELYSELLNRKN